MLRIAGCAVADVNKCNVGGTIVFQDGPCPGAKFEHRDTSPAAASAAVRPATVVAPASSATTTDGLKARLATYERERHIRESQQQIEDLQRGIANRNDQITRDLASLQAKKGRATNNLAGAQWEQSINSEMAAVTGRMTHARKPASCLLSINTDFHGLRNW